MDQDELCIVWVHATWCHYCEIMQDDWMKFMTEYDGRTINGLRLLIVDMDEEDPNQKVFMDEHDIDGYPSIIAFKYDHNGKLVSRMFEGDRNYDAFVRFITDCAL